MKPCIPLRHLTFLAICVALSLVTKRVISPATNVLTDLIRIPGGGTATAFSLMFLIVGTGILDWRWAATAACFVQALLALSLGMSAYQGGLALVTYSLPGLVIDLFRNLSPRRDQVWFSLCCGAANSAGALLTNLLVFRLKGIAFLLWMLVAASAGLFGGLLGEQIFRRIRRTVPYGGSVS